MRSLLPRIIGVAALGALPALLPGCGDSAPNVLLISVDTLRADHLGIYGYSRDTSPRIDAFFGGGTVFDNAISPAPCTVPAVRQYMTGIYIHDESIPSLPEILRTNGYETAAFVSQHVFHWDTSARYDRGFDVFDIQSPDEIDAHGFSIRKAAEVSDSAIQWLDTRESSAPFFVWLHFLDPHDPYDPPEEFRLFGDVAALRSSGDRRALMLAEDAPEGVAWNFAADLFSDAEVDRLVALYDGEIRHADFHIGRVLDRLASSGQLANSIVVLVADHGEMLGEDGAWWDHCSDLNEAQIRIPLLIRSPAADIGSLGRTTLPASSIDLVPSLLAALGIEVPPGVYSGADLAQAPSDRITHAFWYGQFAARNEDWKLRLTGTSAALYRISEDPAERHDRSREAPEVRAALEKRIEELTDLLRESVREDAKTVERLRALGYID